MIKKLKHIWMVAKLIWHDKYTDMNVVLIEEVRRISFRDGYTAGAKQGYTDALYDYYSDRAIN